MKEEKLENQKNFEDKETLIEDSEILIYETNENENIEEENPLKEKIINQKTALLVIGGSLLAGTGFVAGINKNDDKLLIDTNNDNIADTILTDENKDGIYDTETEIVEIEPEIEEVETDNESSNNNSFNIDTAPHTQDGTVTNEMSFSEAFEAARTELGAGGVFEWNGQLYGTFYENEVDENHNPTIQYNTTKDSNYQTNKEKEDIEDVELKNENTEKIVEVEPENEEEIVEVEPENIEEVIYDGETSKDIPDDVPDAELDEYDDDLIALNDDFDDTNDWI